MPAYGLYHDSLAPPIMHWDSCEGDLDPCCERETLGASIVGEQVPLPPCRYIQ